MELNLDTVARSKSALATMITGLVVNIVLFIVKLYIGLATNSIVIMSDAMNNLGDTFSCAVAVLSFALVLKGRGDRLAHGFGRMEYLADVLMSVIICIVGAGFIYSAIERLVFAYLMVFTWLYFGIIAATALVKVGLGLFYRYRNRKVDSGVLRAASIDSFTDAGITVMALIGYSLNQYAKLRIDAIFGLIVSGIMIYTGIRLLVSSVRTVLGEKPKKSFDDEVRNVVLSCENVRAVSDVELHDYGAGYRELIVGVVFTKGSDYDTIINTADKLTALLKEKFGYEPKICLRGEENESES